jgi:purine-nucleoside phosphorylase
MNFDFNPYMLARAAANELCERSGVDSYDIAIILGSGWSDGAEALGVASSKIEMGVLTGFETPNVLGHEGTIQPVLVGGLNVALVRGRVHLYEGYSPAQVCHCVRTLVMAGAKKVILTNACGGLDPSMEIGSVALIRDHINLMGTSPMEGPEPPEDLGSRFVDLMDLYSKELRERVHEAVDIKEGVYAGFRGPNYETPAEIEMARTIGASLVGMSTVLEAIAAKHLGAEVLGLSLVTDKVGEEVKPLSHLDVLAAAADAAEGLGRLLGIIVPVL